MNRARMLFLVTLACCGKSREPDQQVVAPPARRLGVAAAVPVRCTSIADALAKLPRPQLANGAELPWPPNNPCTTKTASLATGVDVIEVACPFVEPIPEHSWFVDVLYRRLPDGCLAEIVALPSGRWGAFGDRRRGGWPEQLLVQQIHQNWEAPDEIDPSVYSLDAAGTHYEKRTEAVTPLGPFPTVAAYCKEAVAKLSSTTKTDAAAIKCAKAQASQVYGGGKVVVVDNSAQEITLVTLVDSKAGTTRFDLAIAVDLGSGTSKWHVVPDVAISTTEPLNLRYFGIAHSMNDQKVVVIAIERDPNGEDAPARQAGCAWRAPTMECERERR